VHLVERLAKGKAQKCYEFDCKVSVARAPWGNWIVGAQALHRTRNCVLKSEYRMERRRLRGRVGDQLNAVLSAYGFNLRTLLRAFFMCRLIAGVPEPSTSAPVVDLHLVRVLRDLYKVTKCLPGASTIAQKRTTRRSNRSDPSESNLQTRLTSYLGCWYRMVNYCASKPLLRGGLCRLILNGYQE
jgi:hypothetical protein